MQVVKGGGSPPSRSDAEGALEAEARERVRGIEPPLSAWEPRGAAIAPCVSWAFAVLGCLLMHLINDPLPGLMARIWHVPRLAGGLRQA